jgi:nitrate reductase gamma subunit
VSDSFLFGVFPYVAVAIFVVGVAWRARTARGSFTSRSSEFLEKKALFWGSVPWHYAILAILAAHLLALVFARAWGALLGDPTRLVILEVAGLALGIWATVAILLLILRRVASPRLRVVTTVVDWIVLALLLVQVATGVQIALTLRWGSVWYLHTAVPWLASLLTLAPQVDYAGLLPGVVKLHAVSAFVLLAVAPFSRLVHALALPISYLWRPYQVVVWNRKFASPSQEPIRPERGAAGRGA